MSKIENTIGGAGVLFVKNVDSNCKIQKILPAFIFFITYIGKKRRRRSTGGSMWYMKTRGFLLKRHSFTKLQSLKKLVLERTVRCSQTVQFFVMFEVWFCAKI